jgi:hypothetical protein
MSVADVLSRPAGNCSESGATVDYGADTDTPSFKLPNLSTTNALSGWRRCDRHCPSDFDQDIYEAAATVVPVVWLIAGFAIQATLVC